MSWIQEQAVWILGAVIALVSTYFFGRKDGKNAAQNKAAKNAVKMATNKNDIAARVNSTPVDELRYRD